MKSPTAEAICCTHLSHPRRQACHQYFMDSCSISGNLCCLVMLMQRDQQRPHAIIHDFVVLHDVLGNAHSGAQGDKTQPWAFFSHTVPFRGTSVHVPGGA